MTALDIGSVTYIDSLISKTVVQKVGGSVVAEGTDIAAVVMMMIMQIHSAELQVQLLTNISIS